MSGSFTSRIRVGTGVAPNNTTQRGVPMQIVYRQAWVDAAALDTDGHLATQSIATAVTVTTFTGALAGVHDFARAVQVVASGAATSTVIVTGKDQHGNTRTETLTLTGATPVIGKVAFKSLTSVYFGATAGTTVDLGSSDVFGLDYKMTEDTVFWELEDGVAATAGTVVAGTATANTDPLGTYDPNSAADGSADFVIYYVVNDPDALT